VPFDVFASRTLTAANLAGLLLAALVAARSFFGTLLMHGWPSTVAQMRDVIPLLASGEGGGPAFDVVAPSLPGFGFSDRPSKPGMSLGAIAGLFAPLMTDVLGYERFVVRATDLGAGVAQQLALMPDSPVVALHQGGTNPYIWQVPDDLSEAEQRFVERAGVAADRVRLRAAADD